MTELCKTCLGCQALENPRFQGAHRCPMWVDSRQEPEQLRWEEIKNVGQETVLNEDDMKIVMEAQKLLKGE